MPATETLTGVKANLLLNNGSTASGGIRTLSQSIGTLEATRWDADKALAIIEAMSDCVAQTLYGADAIKTYKLLNAN